MSVGIVSVREFGEFLEFVELGSLWSCWSLGIRRLVDWRLETGNLEIG